MSAIVLANKLSSTDFFKQEFFRVFSQAISRIPHQSKETQLSLKIGISAGVGGLVGGLYYESQKWVVNKAIEKLENDYDSGSGGKDMRMRRGRQMTKFIEKEKLEKRLDRAFKIAIGLGFAAGGICFAGLSIIENPFFAESIREFRVM